MKKAKRMSARASLGWLSVAWAWGLCVACGFDSTTPATQPSAGSSGSGATAAGTSSTSGGTDSSAAGTASGGAGTAGSTAPTTGANAGDGGSTTQGGTGGAAAGAGGSAGSGMGGMSVAGGPPAYTTKPMSVVAYSPYRDGQAPGGTQPTKEQVKEDLMLLKPYVDGVRVYGTDGANAYIPALCDELGIDLHIGAWIDGIVATDEPNVHALAAIVNAKHPSIKTAIIGNEVLARSAKNMMTEEKLLALINIFKAEFNAPGVKIAAADTYPQWMVGRPNLAAAVDIVIWHTYGWWSGINIEKAYPLVSSRYDDMIAKYPGKPLILGETGWPTQVDHMSTDLTTTAVGNEANQAKFYKEALAGMRARNLPMWMFSSIDEKWKGTSGEGEVGAHWGIFTSARVPKQAATEMMIK